MAGAPNLGGHNRSGESIKATKAKQKMQQTQPGSAVSTAAALARRAGSYSGNVAQVPNAGALQTSMGLPQGATWDQAPLLVRVRLPFCPFALQTISFACFASLSSACLWMCQSMYKNREHNQHAEQCRIDFQQHNLSVSFRYQDEPLCLLSVCLSDASMCQSFSDCCAPCFICLPGSIIALYCLRLY